MFLLNVLLCANGFTAGKPIDEDELCRNVPLAAESTRLKDSVIALVAALDEGYEKRALQHVPHLVLLDPDFYESHLRPLLYVAVLLYVSFYTIQCVVLIDMCVYSGMWTYCCVCVFPNDSMIILIDTRVYRTSVAVCWMEHQHFDTSILGGVELVDALNDKFLVQTLTTTGDEDVSTNSSNDKYFKLLNLCRYDTISNRYFQRFLILLRAGLELHVRYHNELIVLMLLYLTSCKQFDIK